jgi:multiple sugar transport system permease protein
MGEGSSMRKVFQFKYSMVYPVVFMLLLVIVAPLLHSFYVSLHRYIFQFGMGEWTYAKNYIDAFRERVFIISMKNTFVLTFSVVSLEFSIALFLALLLTREDVRLRKYYTIILLIPIMMPPIVVGLIWKMLLHPELGIINYLLGLVGIPPQGWYGDPRLAMLTVIGVDVWHETSLILIILLAGLTSLDKTPYEAAKVDGANSFQVFLYITMPMMTPVITVAILIRMIAAIKTYDLIYILTRGGPGHKTDTMSYYVFKMAFRKMSVGDASAQSFILLIIILVLSLILIKMMEMKRER